MSDDPPATVSDVHAAALRMPGVRVSSGRPERPVYQGGGKWFVFFRSPRPDAVDPETGERYDDDVTTRHFDGHPSVLVRASRLSEVSRAELAEIVEDAWLSRASPARVRAWLRDQTHSWRPGFLRLWPSPG